MAYTAVIVTVAEMQFAAGANVNPAGDVEANHIALQNQAMGYLSGFVQDDVSAGFAAYDAVTKVMLTEWAARYAGMELIRYDPSTYTDLIEAEDMIQVHIYRMEKIEEELAKGEVQKQIKVNN